MKTCSTLVAAILILIMGLVVAAPAEVAGRLTMVEGRVDLLKGGQLPSGGAKLEDTVSPGDVLRTKSLSKAQITFSDNTVLTISPETRLALEEYMFDANQGKRNAVLKLFQGMVLTVVSKLYKTEKPDFIIQTHTAVLGVRGTEVGVRLSPNDSTFLNFQGLTRVRNIFPEVSGDLFRKAAKVAISFDKGYVDLRDMQGTVVARGLPPTLPYTITDQDRQMFMRQLGGAFSQRLGAGHTVASNIVGPSGTGGSPGGSGGGLIADSGTIATSTLPVGINSGVGVDPTVTLTTGIYTPPKVVPPPPPPPPPPPAPPGPVHPPR